MRFLSRDAAPKKQAARKNTGGRRPKPVRRKAPPRWAVFAARASLVAAITAVVAAGPVWLWQSGWIDRQITALHNSAIQASADAGLTVENILLTGRHHTERKDLAKLIGVKAGDPILNTAPSEIRARLEALAWIKSAHVERRLPDTLAVRIVERRPIALWQRKGKLTLIDADGTPITRQDLERFGKLIVVVGEDAPKHTRSLFVLLAEQRALADRVRAAVRVGQRRWNLRLDNGIDVRLPEVNPSRALARLASYHRDRRLLDRDVVLIDMRLPDRMVVRTRGGDTAVKPGRKDKNT